MVVSKGSVVIVSSSARDSNDNSEYVITTT